MRNPKSKPIEITQADRDAYRDRRRPQSVRAPEMVLLRDRLNGNASLADDDRIKYARDRARGAFRPLDWSLGQSPAGFTGNSAPTQVPQIQWLLDDERGYCDWPSTYLVVRP